jgi:cystathionine gamma-lyase
MQRHCENALQVAKFLESDPNVESVIYPGLESHPQHELAKRQIKNGFGGMVSFRIKGGDLTVSNKFLSHLKVFALAESLGGIESLIELPAVMTHASVSPEMRHALGITDNLIRISVGVEDVSDLIHDIAQALEAAVPTLAGNLAATSLNE